MLGRGSTFADEQIVSLLKHDFVPVAIDQAYQRRQQDAEGELYRKIAGQGPRSDFRKTTQGLYVADAAGNLLGYTNHRAPARVKRTIDEALGKFRPAPTPAIERGRQDPRYNPDPPKGGLVVRVHAKVLGGYEETTDPLRRIQQSSLSRDNLWISRAEHRALSRGRFPDSLATRIARFHLVDNTRGEPPLWREEEVRSLEMTLRDGVVTGDVRLATADGDRGYEARLFGLIENDGRSITRIDLVAHGDFWGEGRYTRDAPQGRFPLGIAFTLADGSDAADAIPPHGSRGSMQAYLEP